MCILYERAQAKEHSGVRMGVGRDVGEEGECVFVHLRSKCL